MYATVLGGKCLLRIKTLLVLNLYMPSRFYVACCVGVPCTDDGKLLWDSSNTYMPNTLAAVIIIL